MKELQGFEMSKFSIILLEETLQRRHFSRLLLISYLLISFLAMTTVFPSICAAKQNASPMEYFDPSKFEPLSLPEKIPSFIVIDQRATDEVFFKMKKKDDAAK